MSDVPEYWPEPIIRVQSLADSGSAVVPDRYIKPPSQRPSTINVTQQTDEGIPLVDLSCLESDDDNIRSSTSNRIYEACKEWGFFQVINHGVDPELLRRTREAWRGFFHLPIDVKQEYANTPKTYEGYGSRLGVQKGAILDWSDYYYLHLLPNCVKDHRKWPAQPVSCKEETEEYGKQLVNLSHKIMKVLSKNLGLREEYIWESFGGEDIGATLRVNYYPKCPQPDLTLGLSSHSDPGGLTLLLPDELVAGLQVRQGDKWITIKPVPGSIVINIGDQIEVLSNAIYKSVEHRVVVNSAKERISLAFFCNPKGSLLIKPAKELVTPDRPVMYEPMTFDEYRLYMRRRGPLGKSQVESLKSPR